MSGGKIAKNKTGPLRIEALANGGRGLARDNGRVIFVAGAFPGDLVTVRLSKIKKSYAQGEVVELLQPSSLRRKPPCPVADECGGCQWQQLPYAEQLKWKQQLFVDTLHRRAGVSPSLVRPIVPAPEEFGYRSRVQIKCFLSPAGFVTGFYRPQSRFVVSVDRCPLMAPALNELLVELRSLIGPSRFAGQVPQLDLAVGADAGLRAIVHFLGDDTEGLTELLEPHVRKTGYDLALQHGRKETLQLLHGSGELGIVVDQPGLRLKYAAGGFAQVNLSQNVKLVDAALAAAELNGRQRVLDLYCGMGNFSLPLARRAKFVIGVEDYAPSIAMAKCNSTDNHIDNVAFHVMPAEQALVRCEGEIDLLMLDPPRSGAYEVAKQLLQRPVDRVVYVSCDPQTLARDLQVLLNGGYRLVFSQAFDMFPQTHHVESLTCLEYSPE